jgi:hypothetical protein
VYRKPYRHNRVENGGFRWISYQEAREQEFVATVALAGAIIGSGRAKSLA